MLIFKLNRTVAASAATVFCILILLTLHEPKPVITKLDSGMDHKYKVVETSAFTNVEKNNFFQRNSNSGHGVNLTTVSGNLITTISLKKLFDFYLSSIIKFSKEEKFNNIKADLEHQLSGPSLQQALTILENYFSYKIALIEFDKNHPTGSQQQTLANLARLTERNNALIALQDRLLNPTIADIFFSTSRRLDNHTLAKANILLSELSDNGKEQALVNLNAQQPLQVILQQKRGAQQAELMAININSALTKEEKFVHYAKTVGEDAAIRLRELDQQRLQWNLRLEAFRNKQQELKDSGLAKQDYETSYHDVLNKLFKPHEHARAEALAKL